MHHQRRQQFLLTVNVMISVFCDMIYQYEDASAFYRASCQDVCISQLLQQDPKLR